MHKYLFVLNKMKNRIILTSLHRLQLLRNDFETKSKPEKYWSMILLQDATFFPIFLQKWENKTKGQKKNGKIIFQQLTLQSEKINKQPMISEKHNKNAGIEAFVRLANSMRRVSDLLMAANLEGIVFTNPNEKALYDAAIESEEMNPWFSRREVAHALHAIARMLNENDLTNWLNEYAELSKSQEKPKKVAVIMAGNIPLVGFHDFLCVLVSGHRFAGKLSSQDALLPVAVAKLLTSYEASLGERIEFTAEAPADADAVIASGSDNTARYFEYNFGEKLHLIRRNRNSAAVLTGKETNEDLAKLGEDVFAYYGLGCRSVSYLLLPAGFEISRLEQAWATYHYVINNIKYHNNLLHKRAILAASGKQHVDLEHCLLIEDRSLASPVGVLNYRSYENIKEAGMFIKQLHNSLQCVVCANDIDTSPVPLLRPGESQHPGLADYADGVDTLSFLSSLG